MVLTVSINGPDNAGKTTQIALLPHHWSIKLIGSLHEYCDTLRGMMDAGNLKDWWWSCPDQEFVSVIFNAFRLRRAVAVANESVKVAILDRGTDMLEAVTVATIAVKNGHQNLDIACETFRTCISVLGHSPLREEVRMLLKQHRNMDAALAIGLERETAPVDERYRQYQTLLHREISRQEQAGVYQHVFIEEGQESHRQIQDSIRAALAGCALAPVLTPLLGSVHRIYAIGGLSECGKSTTAMLATAHFGVAAHRLKIGYFLDLASKRQGRDIYSRSEREQAFALCGELHAYLQAHYWVKYVTLESVHRFESIRWLKQILGDTLRIIYVDVDLETRKLRSLDPLNVLEEKDATKKSRGANRVKDIADYVLDNSVSRQKANRSLKKYLRVTIRET